MYAYVCDVCVCVCVGSMCKASVAPLVCLCVPCGSRGQAEGIGLTDVTVSLYAGLQTRHIHLF